MNAISNATLRHLIEQPAGAYVSAYLPLEHGAVGTLRNQVALKLSLIHISEPTRQY